MDIKEELFPQIFTISRIIRETPSCSTFHLIPERGNITYKAGQYFTFNNHEAEPAKSRSYSISSAPHEPHLSITIKRQENGFFSRQMIDQAQVGDKLRAIGVFGNFILPQTIPSDAQFLFFAAGSGIVPIFSLIKTIITAHPSAHIHLYYSNSSRSQTIFYEALNALQERYKERFRIHYFFSQENPIHDARISAFMIPDILKKSKQKAPYCYLCGPIDYMDTIAMSLKTYGIPAANVYREEYYQYEEEEVREVTTPPDTRAHRVKLKIADQELDIDVQYPVSILETALRQKINLPYSCGSGQCGTCAARVLQGMVWMTYNTVLTEEEVNAGMTLTCMGFPVDGDVTLSF